jgi:hypothetical protein
MVSELATRLALLVAASDFLVWSKKAKIVCCNKIYPVRISSTVLCIFHFILEFIVGLKIKYFCICESDFKLLLALYLKWVQAYYPSLKFYKAFFH